MNKYYSRMQKKIRKIRKSLLLIRMIGNVGDIISWNGSRKWNGSLDVGVNGIIVKAKWFCNSSLFFVDGLVGGGCYMNSLCKDHSLMVFPWCHK